MPWWNSTPPWLKLTSHHLLKPLAFQLTYIAEENMLLNKSWLKIKGVLVYSSTLKQPAFFQIYNNLHI